MVHRIRLLRPVRLLSVACDGACWQLDDNSMQLAGAPLVIWRWGLIVPLSQGTEKRWLWLWWFQLNRSQLALLRHLALLAHRQH